MKGIGMMLKSLGINIDPAEVETLFNNIKVWVPELITYTRHKLETMDSRLAAIELRLEKIERNSRLLPNTTQHEEMNQPIYCEVSNCKGTNHVHRDESGGMGANGRS